MATDTLPAQMTDEEPELHAFSVLAREIGLAGYARFVRLFCSGRGDYTAERYKRTAKATVADVLGRLREGVSRRDRRAWTGSAGAGCLRSRDQEKSL